MEGARCLPRGAWQSADGLAELPRQWRLRVGGVRELGERVPADGGLRHPDRLPVPARLGGVARSRQRRGRARIRRPPRALPASSAPIRWAARWPACSSPRSFCTSGGAPGRQRPKRPCTETRSIRSSPTSGDMEFWFESFQNRQSEFLATAVLVVLSIVLRFRGSPESEARGREQRGDRALNRRRLGRGLNPARGSMVGYSAATACRLADASASCVRASSVLASSCSVASSSLAASAIPRTSAQRFRVP